MAARCGPRTWPSRVVRRGDTATHIDTNILPVLFWLFGRRLATVFRYCTGDTNMATRKKRSKTKRASKKVKQTKTDKPSMTEQLKEARKRYTVSKSAKGTTSAHNGDDVATLLAGNTPEGTVKLTHSATGKWEYVVSFDIETRSEWRLASTYRALQSPSSIASPRLRVNLSVLARPPSQVASSCSPPWKYHPSSIHRNCRLTDPSVSQAC